MLYEDYLNCAEKHLKSVKSIFSSYKHDENERFIWLELYYLSGYIMEGITTYSAYKLYEWPERKDITKRDDKFYANTYLDYYQDRKDNGKSVYKYRGNKSLCIQNHNFQLIIKDLLQKMPSLSDIPYFGSGNIDDDVIELIDNWKPNIRYETKSPIELNEDIINHLIDTCNDIYEQIKINV